MAESPRRPRSLQSNYVDAQGGWRYMFFSLAIAAIAGLAFRLYFSPDRLKAWVNEAVQHSKGASAFAFDGAQIRLARGSIPQFAVVLTGVRLAPAPQCRPEPSLTIQELTLPLRISTVIEGKFAVGTITAEDMTVDLDGIKERCDEQQPTKTVTEARSKAPKQNPKESQAQDVAGARPWWQQEQLARLREIVEGVEFKRVELQFEKKAKHIDLERFEAQTSNESGGLVLVSTDMRFPPEVVFGEKLPVFTVEARARPDRAEVELSAHLDEGKLHATAALQPAPNNTLDIDLAMKLIDVPLSTVVPLMRKAGITDAGFQPRFLWMNCDAKIAGPFQGLFDKSPLKIENCAVAGDGARIEVAAATRRPNGSWDAFKVHLAQIDLGKLFRTLGLKGPEGISSDFGRLDGDLELKGPDDAKFNGAIENAKLVFSRRNARVEQNVPRLAGEFRLEGGRFRGNVAEGVLENGEFAGSLKVDLDRRFKNGTVTAELRTLVFDPRVQQLLVNGLLGPLSGHGEAKITDGKLTALDSELSLGKTEGREWRFDKAALKSSLESTGGVTLAVSSPGVEINRSSAFYQQMEPIFFSHRFEGDWLELKNVSVEGRVPEGGGVRWSKAVALADNGRIHLTSEGAMSREHAVFGWVEVDYPKVKRLRWSLGGITDRLVLTENSPTLTELRKRVSIDDETLGLQ